MKHSPARVLLNMHPQNRGRDESTDEKGNRTEASFEFMLGRPRVAEKLRASSEDRPWTYDPREPSFASTPPHKHTPTHTETFAQRSTRLVHSVGRSFSFLHAAKLAYYADLLDGSRVRFSRSAALVACGTKCSRVTGDFNARRGARFDRRGSQYLTVIVIRIWQKDIAKEIELKILLFGIVPCELCRTVLGGKARSDSSCSRTKLEDRSLREGGSKPVAVLNSGCRWSCSRGFYKPVFGTAWLDALDAACSPSVNMFPAHWRMHRTASAACTPLWLRKSEYYR